MSMFKVVVGDGRDTEHSCIMASGLRDISTVSSYDGFHELLVVSLETSSKGLGAVLVMSLARIYQYMFIRSLLHSHQTTLRDPHRYASTSSYLLPHLSTGQQVDYYHHKTQKVRVSRCLRTLYR